MPSRILKESICTSATVDALSADEERLFYRILVNCDDYGRMDARLPIVRARCFPLKPQSLEKGLRKWLTALERGGLIVRYVADGHEWLQVITWERHQQVRAKRSKCPAPPEQLKSSAINGSQIPSESGSLSESESGSNPNPANGLECESSTPEDFEVFWHSYPRKIGKQAARRAWPPPGERPPMPTLLARLEDQCASAQWQQEAGRYIPHAATWLRGRRWEDELPVATSLDPKTAGNVAALQRWLGRERA